MGLNDDEPRKPPLNLSDVLDSGPETVEDNTTGLYPSVLQVWVEPNTVRVNKQIIISRGFLLSIIKHHKWLDGTFQVIPHPARD